MNNPSPPNQDATSRPGTRLLDAIKSVRASVGDGLNDDELTRLLRQTGLPNEAGFGFLSFSSGFVTLTVPPQAPADWYPETGWIMANKERVARAIAEKYELVLCEPPDRSAGSALPRPETPAVHHHLELTNAVETVVIAHPQYLKVRLFGAVPEARYLWNGQAPLRLGPGLLEDLAGLYRS